MSTSKVPQLPPTEDSEAGSLRYEVNPAIALSALSKLYKQVQQHQLQLRQLAKNIHQVYAEGPVVSGWLASEASLTAAVKRGPAAESSPGILASMADVPIVASPQAAVAPQPLDDLDVALFRHGDANDLMNYLSALESSMLAQQTATAQSSSTSPGPTPPPSSDNSGSSQYYLCQLDSSGQIQAEQCPPEQVPVLSMAIARYRRLDQLIKKKQGIEAKLQAIVDILGDAQQVLAQ